MKSRGWDDSEEDGSEKSEPPPEPPKRSRTKDFQKRPSKGSRK